jgi:NAD(P)-dependent dehydrogenase (short-subunit alcohol dehydrogenase family)
MPRQPILANSFNPKNTISISVMAGTGTVLLTGANGSLAIPMVKYLLSTYPTFTFVLIVRDDSDDDLNTAELRRVIAGYSDATASIRKLDLASLKQVQGFSDELRSEIQDKRLPHILAIICNAMSWRLSGGPAYSEDGYETSIAINHLAHFALSLRLLGSMDARRGRVVFLGSEAHWPLRAGFSKGYPTHIPENIELLVHPEKDKKEEEMGRGFQRYGTSKLVPIMVMYELNRRLKKVCSRRFQHSRSG